MAGVPLQPINVAPAQGVVDANGNLTIRFGNVPPMQVWTATVSVPAATPDIKFLASISEVPATTFYGSSPGGPFSLPPQSQLKLTASNLKPGVTYTAVIAGSAIEQDLADPAPANAPPATNAVSIINEEIFVAGPINDGGAGTTVTVNVAPSWGVLHFFNAGNAATLKVVGAQTGFVYSSNTGSGRNQLINNGAVVPVLIDPSADRQVTVTVTAIGVVLSTAVYVTAQLTGPAFVVNSSEQPLFIAAAPPAGVGPGGLGFGYNFDVVPYGGTLHATATIVTGGVNVAMLPAPVAGTAYRLHRMSVIQGAAGSILGHTTGFFYGVFVWETAAGFGPFSQSLDGQIVAEGLDLNSPFASQRVDVSYDIVATPVIT